MVFKNRLSFFLIVHFLFYFISEKIVHAQLPEMKNSAIASEWIERRGQLFFLNGQGIHTVSLFKIQVYKISLFLEKRSKFPEEIITSAAKKIILLKFLRDLGAAQLRLAFSDGFYENCAIHCQTLKPYLEDLNSKISDMKEGDSLEFQFFENRVIFNSSVGSYFEVKNPNFGRILLSIWLGSSPPSALLKENLLGISGSLK